MSKNIGDMFLHDYIVPLSIVTCHTYQSLAGTFQKNWYFLYAIYVFSMKIICHIKNVILQCSLRWPYHFCSFSKLLQDADYFIKGIC